MTQQLVVEWTRAHLRVALAKGGGVGARLRLLREDAVASAEEVSQRLRQLRRSFRFLRAQVVAVLPREQVITRLVKFPSVQTAELRQMVHLYAKTQLPYPSEQAVMDFYVVQQENGFTTVVVIAAQREIVERHWNILRAAGFRPSLLTVSSWGALGWYRKMLHPQKSKTAAPLAVQEPVLIVNVDQARTEMVVIRKEAILSSRSMAQGLQDWHDAGEGMEILALEIERSRVALRKELPDTEVQSVLLAGLTSWLEGSEAFAERLGLPLKVIEAGGLFPEWKASAAMNFSPLVVGGLALSGSREWVCLNPPEIAVETYQRRQIRDLILIGGLLLGVCGLGATLALRHVSRQRLRLDHFEQLLNVQQPQARGLQEILRAVQMARSVLQARQRLATALAGVFRASPEAIGLEAIAFEHEKQTLMLRGQTQTTQQVLEYIRQLQHLDGVKKVHMKYTRRRQMAKGERVDFELALDLGFPDSH